MRSHKRPISVLVVIHTPDWQVLLLERASHAGYWQSVTGSQEGDEIVGRDAGRDYAAVKAAVSFAALKYIPQGEARVGQLVEACRIGQVGAGPHEGT